MAVKDRVAALLEQESGRFVSGQELADKLGCTRGAVWKAVRTLQSEGYPISAVTNRGYCMGDDADVLSEAGVKRYLAEAADCVFPQVFKCVDSTNTRLRELAAAGAPGGTALIAGAQSAGRGRLGRSFFSPSDTGLYMSLLLRTQVPAEEAVMITTAAAVAVAESIEEISGRECGIKWVNDVYIGERKVCGILTEASMSLENGGLEYAIPGIGINAYEPEGGFPEEIKDIAGAVFDRPVSDARNRLCGEVMRRLTAYCGRLGERPFLEGYRRRLMWRGRRIRVIGARESYACTLEGVDDNCRLLVRTDSGELRTVLSGEISIRLHADCQ